MQIEANFESGTIGGDVTGYAYIENNEFVRDITVIVAVYNGNCLVRTFLQPSQSLSPNDVLDIPFTISTVGGTNAKIMVFDTFENLVPYIETVEMK